MQTSFSAFPCIARAFFALLSVRDKARLFKHPFGGGVAFFRSVRCSTRHTIPARRDVLHNCRAFHGRLLSAPAPSARQSATPFVHRTKCDIIPKGVHPFLGERRALKNPLAFASGFFMVRPKGVRQLARKVGTGGKRVQAQA